jgi:YVTN family beta-propeller protein
MSPRRRSRARLLVFAAGVLAAAGGGARWWAIGHVAHFTGTAPSSLDCVACHVTAHGGTIADRMQAPRYLSPLDIAVSPDGAALYVTAPDSGELLLVDTASRRLAGRVAVGERPYFVALSDDGATAWVSDQDADVVRRVDLAARAVTKDLPSGFAPAGIGLAGDRLVVANALGSDISILDAATGDEQAHLAGGNYPFAVAVSPDASLALVTSLLAAPVRPGEAPSAELTAIDLASRRRVTRHLARDAHLLEGTAFVPGRMMALVTLVRPRNLLPAVQVERGWMMSGGLGVLDLESGELAQLPLDDVERFYADPSDVAVTPDGRTAFVSHGGVDVVTAIDVDALAQVIREARAAGEALDPLADRLGLSARYVRARIPVGTNPRGLAVSPDGATLYVAERLDDAIGVVDVASLRRVAGIDLGGPRHETAVRRGEKVFNSARATLQQQFSCRSCHPENHVDGLQYDLEPDGLGRNIVDNRSLLGLRGTAPFKWNGKNTSLYMQCGIRFARFLTRSEPFAFDDQVALAAFLQSLTPPRNRHRAPGGELTEAQERGKAIFERAARADGAPIRLIDRCATCHSGHLYTDRQRHDVGSAGPWDTVREFDTPHLNNIGMGAPYLHDGKARTLEEIWTVYSPNDEHGITSDLGKRGLNDLIEYLRTL